MPTFSQDQVAGLIRHAVTSLGVLFVARGWGSAAYLDIAAGILATIGGAAWSVVAKTQASPPAPPQPPTPTLL